MPLTTIGTDAIDALAVTTAKLAADAVTTAKIEAGAVGTTDIADNAVDGAKIAMTSDAQGDVLFYGGTDYERLGPGTSGYFLKTQGAAADPIWSSVPAGVTINTNADNRIMSGSDTTLTLNGETNLTYDQTTLAIKNSGTASDIKVYCETANTHYTSIKSAAHAAYTGGSWTFTLPGTDGASGEFLTTNGSGLSSWAAVPAGAPTGGGSEKVFYENENAVDTDYTLTTDFNAVTAGPVTVAAGVTITVPAGQAWVIV